MTVPDRARVIAAVQAALRRELDTLFQMTAMARDEATSAESRPENQYDTRALEASYLAAGQGERLLALERLVAWSETLAPRPFEVVQTGALVGVGTGDWVLIAPRGGLEVPVDGVTVRLVSSVSPLGEALCGLSADDTAEVDGPAGAVEVAVLAVR